MKQEKLMFNAPFKLRWRHIHIAIACTALISIGFNHLGFRKILADITQRQTQPNIPKSIDLSGHTGWIYTIAVSSDSRTLISGSFDKSIRFWNLSAILSANPNDDNQRISQQVLEKSIQDAHSTSVSTIAVARDQPLMASGGWDRRIKFWNLSTQTLLGTIEGAHQDDIEAIAFSPDSTTLVSGGLDSTVKLWNVATEQPIRTLMSDSPINEILVSPNGKLLIAGTNSGKISIWNLPSGNLIMPLAGHTQKVSSLAISPNGKFLISGGADKTLKVWNLEAGVLQSTIMAQSMPTALAFAPNGKAVVSGHKDGSIKLWEMPNCRLIRTITKYHQPLWAIAFSPDGQALVVAGDNATLSVWGIHYSEAPIPIQD